jgi:arylsulfatase A-like enzyme
MLPDRRARWAARETPFAARVHGRPRRRPNILFILADDLGWGDLGVYGSLHNSTPVLDRLAADGVRFRHAYAASPTCSPTRIALYTGRYPGRLAAGLQEPLVSRDAEHGIPAEHPTLPSLLRESGYRAAMFGKWHCGWLPWFSPLRIGFEEFFGNFDGVLDYFSHIGSTGRPDLYEGEVPVEQVGYYTELVSARAAEYIARQQLEHPFYLQLNYTAPHWPWEGPQDVATSVRITRAAGSNALRALFHLEGGSLETYRRMVAALDAGIGTVLEALDDAGLREDTVVVFASDNGGERFAFLWPFVGEKGDCEEGGIRVPLIVRWPAALDGGQVTDVPVITMDWTATLLDAGGTTPDSRYPLDGVSLLPWLLDGRPQPVRDLLWRTRSQGALRRGRHKLLVDRAPPRRPRWLIAQESRRLVRLYDVTADGRERADLRDEHPALTRALLARWQGFDRELLPYPRRATDPAAVDAGGAAVASGWAD